MLKYRILTAIVLLMIIFGMVWLLKPLVFSIVITIFFIISAIEWVGLMDSCSLAWRLSYVALLMIALYAAYFVPPLPLFCLVLLVWLWAAAAIYWYQQGKSLLGFEQVWVKGICGLLLLAACWRGIVLLQAASPIYLLIVFCICWLADTGAYFCGRRWGSYALANRISPKKTWEGFWCGTLLSTVVVSIMSFMLNMSAAQRGFFIILVIFCALFSVVGDLFVSLLKRQVGLKDSGNLLPGHGGLLDRVDSTLSTVPVFALGFLLLGL